MCVGACMGVFENDKQMEMLELEAYGLKIDSVTLASTVEQRKAKLLHSYHQTHGKQNVIGLKIVNIIIGNTAKLVCFR